MTTSNVIALWQRKDIMINPIVSDVIRYWEGLRQGAAVPLRSDVDPRQIREALSHSFILERSRPGTVRFRLSGQHMTELMGMDVRGMPLRSCFEVTDRKRLMEHVEMVFEGPCALDMELVSDSQGRAPLEGQMMLLPLRDNEGKTSRALGVMITDGLIGVPPRRFRIRKQALNPVQPGKPVNGSQTRKLGGFAEPSEPYRPPADATGRPVLKVVLGGKH